MEVLRYRLSSKETRTLQVLASHIGSLKANLALPESEQIHSKTRLSRNASKEVLFWINRDHFEVERQCLDDLSVFLDQLDNLGHDNKVFIIENIPTEHDPESFMFAIIGFFATVCEFTGHGKPIVEVTDKGNVVNSRPSSDNALSFELHTDLSFYQNPPAYIAFFMVQQAVEGGESIFCDATPALKRMPTQMIQALESPFRFPPSVHRPEMMSQFFPILSRSQIGDFEVRFRRDGLTAQNADQAVALQALIDEFDKDAIQLMLESGEMALFSNRKILHGRKAFSNSNQARTKRRALRLYFDRPINSQLQE